MTHDRHSIRVRQLTTQADCARKAIAAKHIRPEPKGRPPLRKCPDDFDIIFVEIGRLECESWYRARRTTINRWLDERGKIKLISLRAAYVRHLRKKAAAAKRAKRNNKPAPVPENPDIAHLAADFLRCVRNGGWPVSQAQTGVWCVGICLRSTAELVAMAERKGFDVEQANLQLEAERRVG